MMCSYRLTAAWLCACLSTPGVVSAQEPSDALKIYRTNQADQPFGVRSDSFHFSCGQNLFIKKDFAAWLNNHTYGGSAQGYGDGNVVADCFYDGTHRRFYTRSLNLFEVADPVDVRLARLPSKAPHGPNDVDWNGRLKPWELLGHIGASDLGSNGVMHYGAAIQFFKVGQGGDGRVGMCLSTAPGQNSHARYSGENEKGEHLQCQVAIFPDGTIVLNFDTDPNPAQPPRVIVQGDLYIGGKVHYFRGDAMPMIFRDVQSEAGVKAQMRKNMVDMSR